MPLHFHRIEAALSMLIHHIPSTVYTFALAGIVLYGIGAYAESEKLSLASLFGFCFPRKHWISRSTKVDAVIYLVSKFTQRFITLACQLGVAFLVSAAVASFKLHLHIKSPLHETLAADVVCLCVIFAMTDFGEFLSHYVQHHVPMLWEFHKVHHSATLLTPLTTTRFHPVGNLIDGFFISAFLVPAVMLAELGFNLSLVRVVELSATVELFFALTFLRQLQHSHFRISFGVLDRVFISPLMHHVHHSAKREHWDKNFGSRLSVWDWWFGCAFLLPRKEPLRFGLGTEEDERGDYQSVTACYVRPLTGFYRLFKAEVTAKLSGRKLDSVHDSSAMEAASLQVQPVANELVSGSGSH